MIKRLIEIVEDNKSTRKSSGRSFTDWISVCKQMATEFPEEYNSKERWRSLYRQNTSPSYRKQHRKNAFKHLHETKGNKTFEGKLVTVLSRRVTLAYIQDLLNATEDQIYSAVTKLRLRGYNIETWNQDGQVHMQLQKKLKISTDSFRHLLTGTEFKVALVSDTHMGHEKSAQEELEWFYRYAHSQGVRAFYHAGDLTDGYYKSRDNSIYEQTHIGFDRQLQNVVDNYPSLPGVVTYFITGNHDVTHVRNGGANIGKAVASYRDDMVYLGHNFAKIWLTEKVDLNLIHPGDGSAYGISLKSQKIIDAAQGKRRAKILAIGHYHKMNHIFWKKIHAFTMPSFQYQTDFMESKNLPSYVGGYILSIKVDADGDLISIIPEFVDLEK